MRTGCLPIGVLSTPRRCTSSLHRGLPTPEQGTLALMHAQPRYEQLHEAIGRADLKASIVATAQAAAIASLLGGFVEPQPNSPHRGLLLLGLLALLVGLGCAGAAVMPRLGVWRPPRARRHAKNLLNIHTLRGKLQSSSPESSPRRAIRAATGVGAPAGVALKCRLA